MAQPGSIGSNPLSATQQAQYQRASSTPVSAGLGAAIIPLDAREQPHAQSAPHQNTHQDMRNPPQAAQSNWGQFIGQLLYSAAAIPFNVIRAAPSAANLGVRGTRYLATPEGQTTASIAMSVLENSIAAVRALMQFSATNEGQQLFTSMQNIAVRLPDLAQQAYQAFSHYSLDPELKDRMFSTISNLSQTTQNIASNVNPTHQDVNHLLTIINTLCDGINSSQLTQRAPTTEQTLIGQADETVGQADDEGDIFYDSVIEQFAQISPTQVTNLINGMVNQASTEAARLVSMIARHDGDINHLCGEFAAYVTNTSINHFTPDELNTIAQSVVSQFHCAIGDLPSDDKVRLMHELIKNNPFGSILTPIIRAMLPKPPAAAPIPVESPPPAATDTAIVHANAAQDIPAPVTFGQRMRRFFAPVTHAVTAFGQGCLGVMQRFFALFTPPRT